MIPGVPGHLSGPLQNAVLCHSTARGCKLAIDLESKLSVAVAIFSLVSNRMAHRISNAQIHLVQVKIRAPVYQRLCGFGIYSGFDPS